MCLQASFPQELDGPRGVSFPWVDTLVRKTKGVFQSSFHKGGRRQKSSSLSRHGMSAERGELNQSGRTEPLDDRAPVMTEDDVMLRTMMKALFGDVERQSEGTVQHKNCMARFYENQSHDGRTFVKFSVHRVANVNGNRQAVNSFSAEDLLNFPGL